MFTFCSVFSFSSFGQLPEIAIFDYPRAAKVTCTQYTEPESTVDVWDWRVPRFEFNYKPGNSTSSSIITVDSPFHNEEGFSFHPNTAHFLFHPGEPNDYQVNDGWELLYRNFGTANEAVGEASFGLYNRYDARVRIFFYNTPVINIKCLSDYITDGYFYETAYYEDANGGPLVYESEADGCTDEPELQLVAVLENTIHPTADDILFSARYKVDIVTADYEYENRPENPYEGMTAEEIFDICDPAPPAPVTDDKGLEKFCRNNYDPEVKNLKGSLNDQVLPNAPFEKKQEILETGVYPNPFTDYFALEIQEQWLGQQTTLQLIDSYGRIVWEDAFHFESTGYLQIKQGVSELPAGQYYMQAIGEDHISSFKLLKL